MKLLLCLIWTFFLCGWGICFEPFVQYHTKDLKQATCYPAGEHRGMMYPGEKPSFVLYLQNGTAQTQDLRVETLVKDYQGKVFAKLPPLQVKLPAAKEVQTTFEAPASREPNHYILYMEIFSGKKKITSLQSAFSCVTPYPGKRDPFFGLDKYGVNGAMVQAYQRLGAGSVGICIGRKVTDDPDKVIPRRKRGKNWQDLLNSDLEVVGALWPTVYYDKRVKKRVDQDLPALCDDEVLHYTKYVRRLVTELKDKVKVWMVMSEYDAAFQTPSFTYFSSTAVLANHVLLTRIAYREIKKIQPEAKVAVLGMMGIDYYHTKPKFKITKFILDDLKKDFDLLCIDAYNGNWHSLRGPLNLPENDFRNFLKDTADLSASYGRPRTVINAENGYSYDFRAGYNDKTLYQIACFTARRLVINRSVPCLFNFWHKASHLSVAAKIHNGTTQINAPVRDMAVFWKTIHSGVKRKYVEVPLLPGATYATAARCLAYVTPSEEIRLGNDIYCYTFTNAKNQTVAALWSIHDPVYLHVDLPGKALKTDMVGRTAQLPEGRNKLLLTQEVLYLTLDHTPVDKLNDAIKKARQELQTPVKGAGYKITQNTSAVFLANRDSAVQNVTVDLPKKRLSVPLKPGKIRQFRLPSGKNAGITFTTQDGKKQFLDLRSGTIPVKRMEKPVFDGSGSWFSRAARGYLKVPDHVFPKRALLPEWGIFQWDDKDISAEYALGYDAGNLYVGVKVKDRIHQQRFSRKDVRRDDALQIAFTSRYGIPEALRKGLPPAIKKLQDRNNLPVRKEDYIVLLALTGKGKAPRPCANCKALGKNQYLSWESNVTRKGSYTLYEIAIPLKKLQFKIRKGLGLRFTFLIHDNNRRRDAASRYYLSLAGEGTHGVQDISCYETLIFE